MKDYPLPWCNRYDAPYWQINLWLCLNKTGWAKHQSRQPINELIPQIEEIV